MENPGNFRLVFGISFLFCLFNLSLGFNPVDNHLIDCGSFKNRSIGVREFVADNTNTSSHTLSTPEHIFANSSSNSIPLYYDSTLYQTARIFNGPSHYSFSIKEQGRHWIRLHFFPFVFQEYDMSKAKFSVSAQNFSLTREPQSGNVSVVKEYCLNITSNNLVLSFIPDSKSFAFINALEVLSIPENVVPEEAKTVDRKGDKKSLRELALETVERVDMGNSTVLPQNDTLWRLWVSDDSYLIDKNLGSFVSNVSAVNFTGGLVTEDIAPASVYGTATRFNLDDPNLNANLTWSFDVDPGFDYAVRLHFCDIVSNSTQQGVFLEIFINTHSAGHLDLGSQTSHVLGAPYFMDVYTRASASRKLNVSVGSSNIVNFPSVVLNGLEIMKINNDKGRLDVPEVVSSRTSKTTLIVGVAVGLFVFVVLAALVFLFCRRRRRKPDSGGGEQNIPMTGSVYSNGTARFPFIELVEATDNFSENLVIGVGGFGKVYKGVFRDETEVAVKRGTPQSSQGLVEFRTEIEMLSQFRHRHLTGPDIDRTHVSTAVKGSFGYLDPEYLTTQKLTEKSDVYSFGVVLLEVLCGRPVIDPSLPREKVNLVDWALKSRRNGRLEDIVDPSVVGEIKKDSLNKFWEITEKCLGKYGIYRPSMGDVLWNLESALQLQGNETKTNHNGELSSEISHGGHSETSLEFSRTGSVGELAGVSMTTVFAQLLSEQEQMRG
ncbi:putative receptor-like protein kinase [Gossypium australe]|uniref:Putative receptor-like protein kinase n=1 Tax=Gossypium australe TaxID=47621 RepID=A0A5B6UB48_9ROSI|nr:putative receptor-like protein kinase [Gossypium australe]